MAGKNDCSTKGKGWRERRCQEWVAGTYYEKVLRKIRPGSSEGGGIKLWSEI